MKRNLLVLELMLSLLVTGQIVKAEESQNLLKNAGFEKIIPLVIPSPKYKNALPGVDEIPKEWMIDYSAFPGMLSVMYDVENSHGGSKYIRLAGKDAKAVALLHEKRVSVVPGKKYSFSVWAKGKGRMRMVVFTFDRKRKRKYLGGISSEWMDISAEAWKEYKFEFTIPDKVGTVTPRFHIKGTVDLDDASFRLLTD